MEASPGLSARTPSFAPSPAASGSSGAISRPSKPTPKRHPRPKPPPPAGDAAAGISSPCDPASSPPSAHTKHGRGKGKGKRASKASGPSTQSAAGGPSPAVEAAPSSSASRPHPSKAHAKGRQAKGRGKVKLSDAQAEPHQASSTSSPVHTADESSHAAPSARSAPSRSKRSKMNTKLTSTSEGTESKTGAQSSLIAPLQDDYPDLRSRLVAELSNGAYECAICCGVVATKASVWSCSRCSAVLHLKCAQMWARTSLDQAKETWRATHPGEDPRTAAAGELAWRCPGCQTGNEVVPTTYTCWCGSKVNPSPSAASHPPGAIRVPHGCGQPCPKGVCEHGCPSLCHPAACPPCPIVVTRECFCGAKTISARCSQLSSHQTGQGGISCGAPCGRSLSCGRHTCLRPCHAGPCGGCAETFVRACFCGKHTRTMGCGEGEPVHSTAPSTGDDGVEAKEWDGYFACGERCSRAFACDVHVCEEDCHAHGLEAGVCPRDPSKVTSCPCGASARAAHGALQAIQDAVLARTKCTDSIPTCPEPCGKKLPCGHTCSASCHEGACPACQVSTTRPCRCGASTATRACAQWSLPDALDVIDPSTGDIQSTCKVVCGTPLSCGKHTCTRRCCPLAFLNPDRAKEPSTSAKRPTNAMAAIAAAERHALLEEASAAERALADPLGLHNCPAVCGKPLACGSHSCERTCHRGVCGRCLNASFEEVSCACGRTVLEPPVPCGTQVACRLPCHRAGPPCGHPAVPHTCHGDGVACPPCVYLTTRVCHCGKTEMANIPCSRDQARIICGQPCDAVLNCGYHRCTGKCHVEGECGRCTQVCGKPRPLCGHACPLRCHAPSVCSEAEACTAPVELRCPCGHLRQTVPCGASDTAKGRAKERSLKCSDACAVAKRNARLAEALGLPTPASTSIDGSGGGSLAPRGPKIVYPSSLLDFYRTRKVEGDKIEKALRDFYALPCTAGGNASTVLPPAKPDVREFTRLLARLYRLDARDVDRDPKRSVMLSRPPSMQGVTNTLLPRPTLREALAEQTRSSATSPSVTLGTQVPHRHAHGAPTAEHTANAYVLDGLFGVSEDELRSALPALSKPRTQLIWLSDSRLLIARPQHSDWRSDAAQATLALPAIGSGYGSPPRILPAKVDWSLASDTPTLRSIAPTALSLSSTPTPSSPSLSSSGPGPGPGLGPGLLTSTGSPSLTPSPSPSHAPGAWGRARPASSTTAGSASGGTAWSAVARRAATAAATAGPSPALPAPVSDDAAALASVRRATQIVPDAWDA